MLVPHWEATYIHMVQVYYATLIHEGPVVQCDSGHVLGIQCRYLDIYLDPLTPVTAL